jgi:hypothetical protein
MRYTSLMRRIKMMLTSFMRRTKHEVHLIDEEDKK